jgi:hypothetical protein
LGRVVLINFPDGTSPDLVIRDGHSSQGRIQSVDGRPGPAVRKLDRDYFCQFGEHIFNGRWTVLTPRLGDQGARLELISDCQYVSIAQGEQAILDFAILDETTESPDVLMAHGSNGEAALERTLSQAIGVCFSGHLGPNS